MKLSKTTQNAVLISTILASSMASIDATALNVVLPSLQQSFGIEGSELMWIVNGYALFLSALLLVGGSIGDLYGRKRVFLFGILSFTAASVLCGLAPNATTLIIARCIQGVGAGFMMPGSLSIISALFPPERRGWAIGTWSMFTAMTTVIGPAIGGWLAELGLWRVVFFINIPISIVAIFFLKNVPENKSEEEGGIDIPGTTLAIVALAALTYGFIEAPEHGFSSPIISASLGLGVLALIAFLIVESKVRYPMMPLHLFRSRVFASINILTLLIYGALSGFLFFFPLNLIQIQNYPSEIAGITMIPFGVVIALLARWSGKWADKVGVRIPLIIGPAICAIGYFFFTLPGLTEGPTEFWTTFLPPILLLSVGMGITVAPLTTAVMNAVDVDHSGVASGVNNALARSAGVLGIAILGTIVMFNFENSALLAIEEVELSANQMEAFMVELPKLGEAKVPEGLSNPISSEVRRIIQTSFIDAFNAVGYIAVLLLLISAVAAWFSLEGKSES